MINESILLATLSFFGGAGLSLYFLIKYFRANPIVEYEQSPEPKTIVEVKEIIVEKEVREKPVEEKEEQNIFKKRGDRFEEYIIKDIYDRYLKTWRLVEWRSDKYIEEIKYFPESSSRPDLEYRKDTKKVAFECKWRSCWSKTEKGKDKIKLCLLYTSPSPRDRG